MSQQSPKPVPKFLHTDHPHTLSAIDTAMHATYRALLTMGEDVWDMIVRVERALIDGEIDAARQVIADDKRIDAKLAEIKSRTFDILARYQPVAQDLRQILAVELVAKDVERIGDHAKNIAKGLVAAAPTPIPEDVKPMFAKIGRATLGAVEDALDAFARTDKELAGRILASDENVDTLYNDLFRALVDHIDAEQETKLALVHFLFMAKSFERIGDHATNVAEMVIFITSGHAPLSRQPA
ncbi:MAG: phosphate signaling complex protein PhoU [Hyphomicrobiaceae bacterium]